MATAAATGAEAKTSTEADAKSDPVPPPTMVLVTLDTTRADYPTYAGGPAPTPTLDRLAAAGTRWSGALTPSPLTLPAHASLLTGLEPPEHGVRDNGIAVLPSAIPTLAAHLSSHGWQTAAFVASRVLDRRFGLARGFDHYDDRMAAEAVGEYGYPERDAAAVTDAALAWLAGAAPDRPLLLWVHYYDPHAPYTPPGASARESDEARYAGEIAYVDRQLQRLLDGLGDPPRVRQGKRWVAVVGDHGEALGAHGERAHGIFLYTPSLAVPLIAAGPGVPSGRVVGETVSSRRLAPTLLALAGIEPPATMPSRLPGLPSLGDDPDPEAVFSETRLPQTAYGWSPLEALTEDGWRLIVAPRPELYHLGADPQESRNLLAPAAQEPPAAQELDRARTAAGDEARRRARALKRHLDRRRESFERTAAPPAAPDAELQAALRSLGYATGSATGDGDGIDPKDGIELLDRLAAAKSLIDRRQPQAAVAVLRELVKKNPSNVPFHTHLARALMASGAGREGLAEYREAVALNPRLDFLHVNLADALAYLGETDEAIREYRLALELNPRSASAWLRLAELAKNRDAPDEERRLLEEAVAAGTASAGVLARLGQLEMEEGDAEAARERFAAVTELSPGWAMGWLLRGQLALREDDREAARPFLEEAVRLSPDGPAGARARRWLAPPAAAPGAPSPDSP